MSELKEILILVSLLIVPVGFGLYEHYFKVWTRESNPMRRDKLSSLWHAIKYWVIVLTTLNIFYANNLTAWFQYLPLMMALFMIFFDLWWNWRNNAPSILYPGNGRGGFIEATVFWLSKRIGLNFTITMILVKLLLIGISILIIIKF